MNLHHRYIRHKKAMDVCLFITSSFDYGHGLALKGSWWNMGYVNSWPIGFSYTKRLNLAKTLEHVGGKAKKGYLKDWEVLTGDEPACLRKGKWVSL